jgi:hypothetical protein
MASKSRWVASVLAAVLAVIAAEPALASSAKKKGGSATRVILDTDFSKWWDDASTIGIANVLHNEGRIRLLGVVSDVKNDIAVAALDALNTAYGNGDIPLGAVAGSDTDVFDHGYTDEVVARLPDHDVHTSADVPEAVALYRELLADQPDKSVTIISVGGYTNIAGLLASEPDDNSKLDGRALIKKKVKRLVQMDGLLPGGIFPVTNQEIDLEAATAVVEGNWPTPIAWVDGVIGVRTRVGRELCTDTPDDHPMHVMFDILFQCGILRDGNWDAPTFLYAIGDISKAFDELGAGGAVVLNDKGGLKWAQKSKRNDLYVHPKNQDRINERIDELLAADA